MCYYNGVWVNRTQLLMLRGIEKDLKGLDLVRPLIDPFTYTATAPIVIASKDKKDYEIVEAHWEYIPFWVKDMKEMEMIRKGIDPKTGLKKIDPKTGKVKSPVPWLNAQGERLLSSSMWAESAKKRRCLFLSTGFFEWREYQKTSYPHSIRFECGEEIFFMAGVYSPWTDKETGEHIITAAIVTAPANPLMAQIHNKKKRMPTMLPKPLAEEWLFDDLSAERIKELATHQIGSEELSYYTVKKDFRTSGNPLERFDYELLPTIVL